MEGFPDSPQVRVESGLLSADPDLPDHPYPTDPRSPFFWRTGAAFADWNGDGKPDLLACVEWSVYPFFAHAALEMDRHPQYRIELVASAGEQCH